MRNSLLKVAVSVFSVASLAAADKLDEAARKDFIAGFGGDQAALERAMKAAEESLVKNPKHAEAMVWHGAATFFLCGQAYQAGDMVKGAELWDKGLKEMADAVALEPENTEVLTVRLQTLTGAAQHPMMPPDMAMQLFEVAVPDGEKMISLLKDRLAAMEAEDRGNLLLGVAQGWDFLGKADKARPYFERVVKELPGTDFEKKAKAWLDAREKPAAK